MSFVRVPPCIVAVVLLELKDIPFKPAMLIRMPQLPRLKVSAQPFPWLCARNVRLLLLQNSTLWLVMSVVAYFAAFKKQEEDTPW